MPSSRMASTQAPNNAGVCTPRFCGRRRETRFEMVLLRKRSSKGRGHGANTKVYFSFGRQGEALVFGKRWMKEIAGY